MIFCILCYSETNVKEKVHPITNILTLFTHLHVINLYDYFLGGTQNERFTIMFKPLFFIQLKKYVENSSSKNKSTIKAAHVPYSKSSEAI